MASAAHPKVKLAGAVVAAEKLAQLTIRQDLDCPDQCELALRNLGAPLPSTTLAAGDALEVELGFGTTQEVVFAGELTGVTVDYAVDRRSLVIVNGFNRLHRLTRGRKSRTFEAMTDQQIAAKIAQEAKLSSQVDSAPAITYAHVQQHNQTDLEFLLQRASRIGYQLSFSGDKTLHFVKRDLSSDSGITLKLGAQTGEHELLRFSPRLSLATRIAEVQVRGWDPAKRKEIIGKASSLTKTMGKQSGLDAGKDVFGNTVQYEVDDKVTSQEEADARAAAILEAAALATITGEAVTVGHPKLRPGLVITLDLGSDTRFSGTYYLVGTVHRWRAGGGEAGGYTTLLKLRRNAMEAQPREQAPGQPGAVATEERAASRMAPPPPAGEPPKETKAKTVDAEGSLKIDGKPAAGAQLVVTLANGEERKVTTDGAGAWKLTEVPPGEYRVRVEVEEGELG